MLTIDGSMGEGGGQILRSALALSLLTQTPITIERIRAGRKKPGLKKQHLTCVRAAAQVGEAETEGADVGSRQLVFRPSTIRGGEYLFDIGTAGSTTLVLQTVLPALMLASTPSQVTLRGGTHNKAAPPFDFLQHAYLPRLAKHGPEVTLECLRHGFYPVGGGELRATIKPVDRLAGQQLLERGPSQGTVVSAYVAKLPAHIGARECDTVRRKAAWPKAKYRTIEIDDSAGPGNVVVILMKFQHVSEVFAGFGERGVRAEQVATRAVRAANSFWNDDVPVGEHLTDQLLLPMGIAASTGQTSSFRTRELSPHATTHIDVLKLFLKIRIDVEHTPAGAIVELGP